MMLDSLGNRNAAWSRGGYCKKPMYLCLRRGLTRTVGTWCRFAVFGLFLAWIIRVVRRDYLQIAVVGGVVAVG
jgi:hypothetical protein